MHERLTFPVALLMVLACGLACSLFRTKRQFPWQLTLQIDAPAADREAAVKETVEVLKRRLEHLFVPKFDVQPQGSLSSGRIVVSLSEVADRERVKRFITARGKLEMMPVISPLSPAPIQTYQTREEADAAAAKVNGVVAPYDSSQGAGKSFLILEKNPIISGQDLRSASAISARGDATLYSIDFALRPEGGLRLADWTRSHINSYLAIVLNGTVVSAAFIKGEILDSGEINGNFSQQQAEDLAATLESGALPAPVKIVGEEFVRIK